MFNSVAASLTAALVVAFLLPAAALAQSTGAPSLPGPNTYTGANIDRPCTLIDAATIGSDALKCVSNAGNSPAAPTVTVSTNLHRISNPTRLMAGEPFIWNVTAGIAGATPEWDTDFAFGSGGLWPDLSSYKAGYSLMVPCRSISTTQINCGGPSGLGQMAKFSPLAFVPTTGSDLAIWLDASDHTTTFASANCTGSQVSTSGTVIASILDKGPNGFCANATGSVTLTASGSVWYLLFNGTSYLTLVTGPGGVNPNTLGDNVGVITTTLGAYYPSDTANQDLFWIATNSSPTTARYAAGFDVGGSTGQGPGMAVRAPDSGSAGALSQGATSGFLATPLAQNVNMVFAASETGYELINNGSFISQGGLVANALTDATTNGGVLIGYNNTNAVVNGTRLYELVIRQPSSAPSGLTQNQTSWWICTKEGTSC